MLPRTPHRSASDQHCDCAHSLQSQSRCWGKMPAIRPRCTAVVIVDPVRHEYLRSWHETHLDKNVGRLMARLYVKIHFNTDTNHKDPLTPHNTNNTTTCSVVSVYSEGSRKLSRCRSTRKRTHKIRENMSMARVLLYKWRVDVGSRRLHLSNDKQIKEENQKPHIRWYCIVFNVPAAHGSAVATFGCWSLAQAIASSARAFPHAWRSARSTCAMRCARGTNSVNL